MTPCCEHSNPEECPNHGRFFWPSMPHDARYEAGRALYHEWCGSSTSDRARYFDSMNRADKENWMRLAEQYASLEVKLVDRFGIPVKLLREAFAVELYQEVVEDGDDPHKPHKYGMKINVNMMVGKVERMGGRPSA